MSVVQAQSRTSQNTILIKENCLDKLQRDIIAGQESKLGTAHLSTVRPSTEAPSAKQLNGQETGNASRGKADDSGSGKHRILLAPLARSWLLTHHADIGRSSLDFAIGVLMSSTSTSTINKRRKYLCATGAPWHTLTISLMDMVRTKLSWHGENLII